MSDRVEVGEGAPAALHERVLAGERNALARAITEVENRTRAGEALLDALYAHTGRAYRVGITGPPGAGKSTLTAALARALRERDRTVGVIAVDPSSPFSGGAVLGDRIRMGSVATDPGVFIRSMASRGALGGLARTTELVSDVMDAAGYDVILIETVGVGQAEVDIAETADVTIVVLSPEAGDAVQTMKAGLMEIADIFCVNKADREGADRMVRAIRAMLSLDMLGGGLSKRERAAEAAHHGGRVASAPDSTTEGEADKTPKTEHKLERPRVPVLRTVATKGEGVEALLEALDRHREQLEAQGLWHRIQRDRAADRIRRLVEEELRARLWHREQGARALEAATEEVVAGRTSPQKAATSLLERFEARLREGAREND